MPLLVLTLRTITRNSLIHSRRVGVYSAFGLGLGALVHFTYCLFGVGVIIAQSVVLFSIVKFLGAAYLLYLGIMALRSGKKQEKSPKETEALKDVEEMSCLKAISIGFFTNLLNPKSALYFLSLFAQVIDPEVPNWAYTFYGIEVFAITVIWFAVLAIFFSNHGIRTLFSSVQHTLEKVLGCAFILFGAKLVLAWSEE